MTITRREWLERCAKLAAAGCVLGARAALGTGAVRGAGAISSETGMRYGVQMFMVRAVAERDLAAAFGLIRQAGFNEVELYPIAYHQPAAQLRKLLGESGLTAVSGHFDYTGREQSVDYAQALGLRYLVCPMLPEAQKLTLAGFHQAAAWFNAWAERARTASMQFVFHNHDYEFKPIDGSNGWTVLMRETDPSLVKLELDMFWLLTAGQNPAEMLRRHADRAVLVHMKDRVKDAPESFVVDAKATSFCTELGKGTVDWPALLRQARAQGIRYAYLDQDDTTIPVEQSMRESHAYLARLGI